MKTAIKKPKLAVENLKPRERTEEVVTYVKRVTITLQIPEKLLQAVLKNNFAPAYSLTILAANTHVSREIGRRSEPPLERWYSSIRGGPSLRQLASRWKRYKATVPLDVEVRAEVWTELQWQASGAKVSVNQWALGALGYHATLDLKPDEALRSAFLERFPDGKAPIDQFVAFAVERDNAIKEVAKL